VTDFTTSDPRCLAVLAKLARARDKMKRLGIPTVLEGHRGGKGGWGHPVKPMAESKPPATVIDFKRGRR
jgi:hypothetical protein